MSKKGSTVFDLGRHGHSFQTTFIDYIDGKVWIHNQVMDRSNEDNPITSTPVLVSPEQARMMAMEILRCADKAEDFPEEL